MPFGYKLKVNQNVLIPRLDTEILAQKVIDEITESNLVISSSLHGIIIAEAYGVPAIWLHNNECSQDAFKFLDYYYSMGRKPIKASSIEEALLMKNDYVPDFSDLQHNLIESFPYDLWKI